MRCQQPQNHLINKEVSTAVSTVRSLHYLLVLKAGSMSSLGTNKRTCCLLFIFVTAEFAQTTDLY
jgi:hypothetical protein